MSKPEGDVAQKEEACSPKEQHARRWIYAFGLGFALCVVAVVISQERSSFRVISHIL